jgi:hypothetical protein
VVDLASQARHGPERGRRERHEIVVRDPGDDVMPGMPGHERSNERLHALSRPDEAV